VDKHGRCGLDFCDRASSGRGEAGQPSRLAPTRTLWTWAGAGRRLFDKIAAGDPLWRRPIALFLA